MVAYKKLKVFLFNVSPIRLAKLTTLNVSPTISVIVNVLTYAIHENDVEMIVGPEDIENTTETNKMIRQFEKNLKQLNIEYVKKNCISASNITNPADSPGVIRKFLTFFACHHIKVRSSYTIPSTITPLIFRTKHVHHTIRKLRNFDFEHADNVLPININNIDDLVLHHRD